MTIPGESQFCGAVPRGIGCGKGEFRGNGDRENGLLVVWCDSLVILFENIQSVPVMVLHADSTEDGANRSCSTALFPDYLAHVRGGNPEAEHRALVSFHRFDKDCLGNINQRSRNLSH